MNRTEHLLSCLAEECTEVGQRVSKALRFGLEEIQPGQALTNAERISEEFKDLSAVAYILMSEGILPPVTMAEALTHGEAKRQKIQRFMQLARETGALVADDAS